MFLAQNVPREGAKGGGLFAVEAELSCDMLITLQGLAEI